MVLPRASFELDAWFPPWLQFIAFAERFFFFVIDPGARFFLAVDYISQLKVAYTDMAGEIDRLRTEVNSLRGPNAPPQPPYQPHAIVVSAHHPPGTNRPNSGDHASTSPEATSRPSLGQNGNHHHGSNGHSGSDSSDKEMDRSPSVPTLHPLQPQTTGSQHQSPFATPTPQVQPQPLPQ